MIGAMSFKPLHDPTHLYFITATVMGWKPLFAQPDYAAIVLGSLDWHRRAGRWELFAYVVMPTHVHAIIKPGESLTISDLLRSFGSFTAHAILRQLKGEQHHLLSFFAQRQDRDRSKEYQIWQPIQAKNIETEAFLREKLEYLHNNPVAKHWRLAATPADYAYSSACYYEREATPPVEVDNVREWLV
jgi:putative transposase